VCAAMAAAGVLAENPAGKIGSEGCLAAPK
jgi:hypothetical protein